MARTKKAGTKKTQQQTSNNNYAQEGLDFNKYVDTFASNLYKTLDVLSQKSYYNPIYANTLMKDITNQPRRPALSDLKEWLKNPQIHEKELQRLSKYLEYNITQYQRTIYHFANILSFKYTLSPLDRPPTKKTEITTYNNCKAKAIEWLKKIRINQQFPSIVSNIMLNGGGYYYIRESNKYIDLAIMPSEYCYINGRASVGFTYAFNMCFFLKLPESLEQFAPEFEDWYKELIEEQRKSTIQSYYKQMPIEKSVIFKFDDTDATMTPPLIGTFKDALLIQDYKDLLHAKAELDTYQLILQKIPVVDGKPTIDPTVAATFVAMVQATLPQGVLTTSTPLEPETIKFSDQSANPNNIIGQGEQNYWATVGVSGQEFGQQSSSVATLKYSNQADYLFMKSLYSQFERFCNYQLSLITGKYKFKVNFFGNAYEEDSEIDKYIKTAQYGIGIDKLIASLGYEPYDLENILADQEINPIYDKLKPLMSAHVMSGKDNNNSGGRPNKDINELTDSGLETIDTGSNDE